MNKVIAMISTSILSLSAIAATQDLYDALKTTEACRVGRLGATYCVKQAGGLTCEKTVGTQSGVVGVSCKLNVAVADSAAIYNLLEVQEVSLRGPVNEPTYQKQVDRLNCIKVKHTSDGSVDYGCEIIF